jgi:hypothetical protein
MNYMATNTTSNNNNHSMSTAEQNMRLAIGSAAAAAAIFAPLSYKWKGVLTAVAADAILTGIYEFSPMMQFLRSANA